MIVGGEPKAAIARRALGVEGLARSTRWPAPRSLALALLFAVALTGCSPSRPPKNGSPDTDTLAAKVAPPGIPQKILFEVEDVNHAWGRQHHGFWIDNEGNVHTYEYRPDEPDWKPASRDSIADYELAEKYAHSRRLVAKLDPVEVYLRYRLIEPASKGTFSKRTSGGNDRGEHATMAYTYDPETRKYKRIDLVVEGDWEYRNLTSSADSLDSWLRRVQAGKVTPASPDTVR